jgi:hypothetical protein
MQARRAKVIADHCHIRGWTLHAVKYWWTRRGWDVYVDGEEALAEIVAYIIERQG